MKSFQLAIVFLFLALNSALAQRNISFTATYHDLGTRVEVQKTIAGVKVIYPEDQEDLIELLEPTLTKYLEVRQKAVEEEYAAIVSVVDEQKEVIEKTIQRLLGGEELSDAFDSSFEAVSAEAKAIASHWKHWGGGVDRIHFYNQATATPFRNLSQNLVEFPEIRYTYREDGNVNMALLPPFVSQFGAGIDKIIQPYKESQKFRCDIALFASPGTSAETVAKDLSDQFVLLAKLQRKVAVQLGGKWIKRRIIESLLISEIENRYFDPGSDMEVYAKALARLYLFAYLNAAEKDQIQVMVPNLFYIPLPETNREDFVAKLDTLDVFADIPDQYTIAASRILFAGLLRTSQRPEIDAFPVAALQESGKPWPPFGLLPGEMKGRLTTAYPDLEEDLAKARLELTQLMETLLASESDSKNKQEPESLPLLALPDDYQNHSFGDFQISGPDSLTNAIKTLGPEWAKKLTEANETLRSRFEATIIEPIKIYPEDYEGLKRYGFDVTEDEIENWVMQTTAMANLAQVVVRLFSGNAAEIWIKEDLIAALKEQGGSKNFELEKGGEKVSANFSINFSPKRREGESVSEWLDRFSYATPPAFPIVIKDPAIREADLSKQIEMIKESDFLIGPLTESADELTPELLTGEVFRTLTEEQSFFVIIHEVVEAALVRHTIGSRDRRWFCDGLANVIAIRECDRRFGKASGMKVFHSLFPPKTAEKHKANVALLDWPAVGDGDKSVAKAEGLNGAHYHFATLAMLKATNQKDAAFIQKWIETIQETNWVRTNTATIFEAYQSLTGKSLEKILSQVTASP